MQEPRNNTVAFWSVKGGSGTSTVAALAARRWADQNEDGVLLVDLEGDQPGLLGVAEPSSPAGIAKWINSGNEVTEDALWRLEREVALGLSLLARGHGGLLEDFDQLDTAQERLVEFSKAIRMRAERRTVVDAGCLWRSGGLTGEPTLDDVWAREQVARNAGTSYLVTRACFMSLRRAARAPFQPTGVVLLVEPGRPLTAGDVEDVIGSPVVLRIDVDPSIARSVDAGLLATRVPAATNRDVAVAQPVMV